jgi:uncharacterized protein (TIGR02246 family)
MEKDEQEIRQVVETWLTATKAGDVETVLGLMTDDVVFLVTGRPPMDKSAFATASRAQSKGAAPKIDGKSEIREVRVLGDWAYIWTRLSVTMTPPGGASPMTRSGHTLSIFRRCDPRWRASADTMILEACND